MKKIYIALTLVLGSVSYGFGQLSRQLEVFKGLEVTDKIAVKLIPSQENKIIIEGELANHMEIVQQSDQIKLKMGSGYLLQGDKVQILLYASDLNSITAKKGASISANSLLESPQISISATEGGKIFTAIKSNNANVSAHTGGIVTVKGDVDGIEIASNLGGQIAAEDLNSKTAVVRLNGGGKVSLYATESVDVQTRAGGVVDVYGQPKQKRERKFAGGKINYY